MTKPLTIPTHLGLNLAAVYHQPSTPGPYPLIILLHGFTGYKEEEQISTLADELVKVDIAALRFDAPGSGESEGTWAEDYRLTKYLEAVQDVLSYAKTNLPIDPNRVALWGHSLGGFVALAAAARHPDDYIAVCGSQPSSGWKILPADQEAKWRTTGWANFESHSLPIKLPYTFFTDRQQYNVLDEARQVIVPVLFIAGTKDEDVPAATIRGIYAAAPEPKTYLEFPTTHDYKRDPENLQKINAATVDFFVRSLKLATN